MTMSLSKLDGTPVSPITALSVNVGGRVLDELPHGYVPPARGGDTLAFDVPTAATIQHWDSYVLAIEAARLFIITVSSIGASTTPGHKRVEASIEPESPTSRGSLPPP